MAWHMADVLNIVVYADTKNNSKIPKNNIK
jgi:hypothetical protein